MMRMPMIRALLLGATLAGATPLPAGPPDASPTPGAEAEAAVRREAFLKRAEAALRTREARSLEELADVEGWRAAGYPELATLRIFLPPAPIVFEKTLTPLESIWRDGQGRRWRLVLREVKGELRAVIRAFPCPRGIVTAPGVDRPGKAAPAVETWTLLECWPLPK